MDINVIPYCDICSKKLNLEDLDRNAKSDNFQFPICKECFKEALEKIYYVISE